MKTNIRQMGCGGCGNQTFKLYQTPDKTILSECTKCKAISEITVSAKLEIKWVEKMNGKESQGCLAVTPR